MIDTFWERFFSESSSTGRHIVKSYKTGKTYAIEAIGNPRTNFGDINTSTKEVEKSYGDKYKGSINKEESLITRENGFTNIVETVIGESPYSVIDKLDKQ